MSDDLERLQGTWRLTDLEMDGRVMSTDAFSGATLEIAGARFISRGMGAVYEGAVILDVATTPKRLTMRFDRGPENGNVNHGIYALDGDIFRLCLSMTGGPAPARFATSPGDGNAFEVFERAGIDSQ